MSEKEQNNSSSCDRKEAASYAALSIGRYFKGKKWKIISFFPNASCAKRLVEADLEKLKKKKGRPSSKESGI